MRRLNIHTKRRRTGASTMVRTGLRPSSFKTSDRRKVWFARRYRPKRRLLRRSPSRAYRFRKNRGLIRTFNPLKSKRILATVTPMPAPSVVYQTYPCRVASGTGLDQRSGNTIFIKGFRMRFTARSTGNVPMTLRMIMSVPRIGTSVSEFNPADMLLLNDSNIDPYVGINTSNSGQSNLWNKINKANHNVIWAKTLQLSPQFENNAASIQSNLDAQQSFSVYIPFNKFISFDPDADGALNDLPCGNEAIIYAWYDDALRSPNTLSGSSAGVYGNILTYFRDASNLK